MDNLIMKIEVGQHVKETYMPYAMSTIVDRALPDVRDGMKPIHRRILYSMFEAAILPNKDRAKTTEPTSETMKIHHHGDTSISDAIALMTEQNESLLHPFIDGEGAFGKVYSKDKPSAPRYTYCRLNQFSMEFFKDLNKEVLHMIGEDNEHMQPAVLSSSFPNILIKNNSGIAVGEACNFPSFNLREICDLTIGYIGNEDIEISDYVKGMDFPTGAYLIYDEKNLNKIYKTGIGTVILRSKYIYDKVSNCIDIIEIPYETTVDAIVAEVTNLIKTDNKYKAILDVRDETGFNQELQKEELKITIDVRKNTDIEKLMLNLFKDTTLQCTFSANMNCLVNYEPRTLGVKEILNQWLNFRIECVKKSLRYDIKNKTSKLHLLTGLERVLLDIDEAVSIIRNSKEDKIIKSLSDKFNIDDIQAEYISNIKLRNINKDYIIKQIKDIEALRQELKNLQTKLNSEEEINKIIINDLIRVRDTYGKPRKTEIIYPEQIKQIDSSELIPDHSVTMVFTKEQYLKKTLRYAEADKQKVKDNDTVLSIIQTTNRGQTILLSNLGNAYKLQINDLQEKQPSAMGEYIPSLIELEPNEKVIGMLATSDFKGYAIIVFENGKVLKLPLSVYSTQTKRTKLKNSLNLDSPVVSIFQIAEDTDILLKSNQNKAVIVNTKDVAKKSSRNSQGVTFMRSNKEDFKVVSAELYKGDLDDSYKTTKAVAGKNI